MIPGVRTSVPLIFIALAISPASAAEQKATDLLTGFKGTRSISTETATSTCIGKPQTPLCAAETFFACMLRNAPSLCQAVGVSPFGPDKAVKERYKFKSARVLTAKNVEAAKGADWARPGNVDMHFLTCSCFADSTCTTYQRYAVVLAPRPDGTWSAVSWSSEADREDFAD